MNNIFNKKDYLTIKYAAKFIGVCPNTLRRWEKAGKILVFRNPYNSYRLYNKDHLQSIIDEILNPLIPVRERNFKRKYYA